MNIHIKGDLFCVYKHIFIYLRCWLVQQDMSNIIPYIAKFLFSIPNSFVFSKVIFFIPSISLIGFRLFTRTRRNVLAFESRSLFLSYDLGSGNFFQFWCRIARWIRKIRVKAVHIRFHHSKEKFSSENSVFHY